MSRPNNCVADDVIRDRSSFSQPFSKLTSELLLLYNKDSQGRTQLMLRGAFVLHDSYKAI